MHKPRTLPLVPCLGWIQRTEVGQRSAIRREAKVQAWREANARSKTTRLQGLCRELQSTVTTRMNTTPPHVPCRAHALQYVHACHFKV